MCTRRGILVSNPSRGVSRYPPALACSYPESGNRGKRARLSSRDSENRFLRVSEQVISLRALFPSLYLALPSAFIRIERKRNAGEEEGEEEETKEEEEEEKEVKVR